MNTDPLLLDALRRMEQVALTQVFDKYSLAIYSYVISVCHDPVLADNIVGDVFSHLLDQLSCGRGPLSNLRAYLFQSAHNILMDQMHYNKRWMPLETVGFLLAEKRVVHQDVEQHILCDGIWQAIQNELTDCQRQVMILRFLEGFNVEETAEIMGKSISNIKVIQHRAVNALRASLDEWSTDGLAV